MSLRQRDEEREGRRTFPIFVVGEEYREKNLVLSASGVRKEVVDSLRIWGCVCGIICERGKGNPTKVGIASSAFILLEPGLQKIALGQASAVPHVPDPHGVHDSLKDPSHSAVFVSSATRRVGCFTSQHRKFDINLQRI